MAIKKAYEEVYSFLKENENKKVSTILEDAGFLALVEAKRGGATGEVVTLKDDEGNLIGRKCSFTGKWFPVDRFYTGASVIKEVEKAKNKVYADAKGIEAEAVELMKEARELTGAEKLEKFEAADAKAQEAEAKRASAGEVEVVFEGGFDTLDELQANL
jgi:hypothetical protein